MDSHPELIDSSPVIPAHEQDTGTDTPVDTGTDAESQSQTQVSSVALGQTAQAAPRLSRGEVFLRLCRDLPMNELGLPKYLYRADLIPSNFYSFPLPTQTSILNAATLGVTYIEGYPTFMDGTPIWEQMDSESEEDYAFFVLYKNLTETYGYRQLSLLVDVVAQEFPDLKPQSLDDQKALLWHLKETSAMNFWLLRVKALDLFEAAMHRKVRESRAMRMENYHYVETDRILRQFIAVAGTTLAAEKLEQMAPEDFIKAVKDLMGLQRQTILGEAGTARGKQVEGAPPPNATLEVSLRQIAKQSGAADSNGGGSTSSNQKVLDMLKNPEATEAAQELILKVGMGGRSIADLTISDKAASKDEAADLAMVQGD